MVEPRVLERIVSPPPSRVRSRDLQDFSTSARLAGATAKRVGMTIDCFSACWRIAMTKRVIPQLYQNRDKVMRTSSERYYRKNLTTKAA